MKRFDLVLDDAKVVTPSGVLEPGWVGVVDGTIAAIEAGQCVEPADSIHHLDGAWLGPGFIDVHTHGSVGIDVMEADAEELRSLCRYFARNGVTAILVGTTTHERSDIVHALQVINEVGGTVEKGATILGAYMEGPFLNPLRKGAHPVELLRPIDRDEVLEYLGSGIVRAVAFAPELADSEWLIGELVDRGITAVAGHTDATYSEIAWAYGAGVSAMTHVFNGMKGLHHREAGAAGAGLLIDGLICEVIADGVHLAPELLKLFWRMKGAQRIALITDAGSFGGMPDGVYDTSKEGVIVEGGVGRLPDGTIASSAKTFDHNFVLFSEATGASFDELWPAASETPARVAGVSDRKGTIELGKDADFAILTPEGGVVATVIGGEWIGREDA